MTSQQISHIGKEAEGTLYGLNGDLTVQGTFFESTADALTAAGTGQSTAIQLTAMISTLGTVASGTGVCLLASKPGIVQKVVHNGANPLTVYPYNTEVSSTINGQSSVTIMQGEAYFTCTAAGAWNCAAPSVVASALNTNSGASGNITLTATNVTGAGNTVYLALTGSQSGGVNAQLPNASAWVPTMHNSDLNSAYTLRVINEGSTQVITITKAGSGSGLTLTGTMTIANNTWRDFLVQVTAVGGSPTATVTSVGVGTYS